MHRVKSLEIDEHVFFQKFEWAFERLGWLFMLGILVAAGHYGVFGRHHKSERIAGEQNGPIWVEYDRRPRLETRTALKIVAKPGRFGKKVRVAINDDYLDRVMIEQIIPEPESVQSRSRRTVFTFAGEDDSDTVVVRIHLQPEKPGRATANITLGDDQSLSFEQLVIP